MPTTLIVTFAAIVVLGGLFAFSFSKKMSVRQIETAPVADLASPGEVATESSVLAPLVATGSVSKVETVSPPANLTEQKEGVKVVPVSAGAVDVRTKTTVTMQPSLGNTGSVSVGAAPAASIPSQAVVSPPAAQPVSPSAPQPVSSATSQPAAQPVAQPTPVSSRVFINGVELSASQMAEFKQTYGVSPTPGRYWYDKVSGAYGNLGGSTAGFMYPGHNYGKMPANASNGNTGVFFNGRELDKTDYTIVSAIIGIPAVPGRYFFDALGNVGYEGTSIALVNLYTAPGASSGGGGGGGGDNFWSSRFSAGNYNSQGQGYVSVPGYGPVDYGF